MHVLFVHQNYPAQFRHIAPRLVSDYGWRCSFATRNVKAPDLPGVERVPYRVRNSATRANHLCTRLFENQVGHAYGVYEALKDRPDVKPDLVVAHSGFGSSLFLPLLYDAPVINFFEFLLPQRRPLRPLPARRAGHRGGRAAVVYEQYDAPAGPGQLRPRLVPELQPAQLAAAGVPREAGGHSGGDRHVLVVQETRRTAHKIRSTKHEIRNKHQGPKSEARNNSGGRRSRFEFWTFVL
jgi:hypothetical protein